MLVKGNLQQLVLSSDIERLLGLEGCLSGNVPGGALGAEGGANGPCGQLARAQTVKVVFGPGTFVNEAADQIDEQLTAQTSSAEAQAKQAERVVTQRRWRGAWRPPKPARWAAGEQDHDGALPGGPGHASRSSTG